MTRRALIVDGVRATVAEGAPTAYVLRLSLLIVLLGCGARTGLDEHERPLPDEPVVRDSGTTGPTDLGRPRDDGGESHGHDGAVSDLGLPPSEVSVCGRCVPRSPRVLLDEVNGLSVDGVWDGEKLLVVYARRTWDTISLAAVDLDGNILWKEPVPATQQPRIAFDPVEGAGLVAFDSGVQPLGPSGRPVGPVERLEVGGQVFPDVAATSDGFLVLMARLGPQGLFFDRFGLEPEPPDPAPFLPGQHWVPEHATDERGRATWVATSLSDGSAASLYRAAGHGAPVLERELGPGRVHGLARGVDGELFVLRSPPPLDVLALERHTVSARVSSTPVPVSGGVLWERDAHLVAQGDDLIIVTTRGADGGPSLFCASADDPGDLRPADGSLSHPPSDVRLASHPRGFVLMWTEAGHPSRGEYWPYLQVFECDDE
jgi:hypothetical protein